MSNIRDVHASTCIQTCVFSARSLYVSYGTIGENLSQHQGIVISTVLVTCICLNKQWLVACGDKTEIR